MFDYGLRLSLWPVKRLWTLAADLEQCMIFRILRLAAHFCVNNNTVHSCLFQFLHLQIHSPWRKERRQFYSTWNLRKDLSVHHGREEQPTDP